ncbi:MAG: PD-(D/E)XK nuclease family protein [Bacteroidetes bacterium]|nr:PD-(D/E)XK nuclease family protein [Bacteroidota bacterium]
MFTHCLQTDKKLLNGFFEHLDLNPDEETTVKTQSIYEFGRPDIEINIPSANTCILIECKIEHFERPNQLEDYKKILEGKKNSSWHLVYLTKYYDFRENGNTKINLHLLKWFDVFQIIDEGNSTLSKELKSYIKDENMAESKNFTYTDLTVLKNITGTIRKMDEVLDGIKEYYEAKIGTLSKESARSTGLKDERYSTYQGFDHPASHFFSISFGFRLENEIWVGSRVYISTAAKYKKTDAYLKLFKRVLKSWEIEEFDNCVTIYDHKPIAQFILEEEEQVPAMVDFLKQGVDKLETLKKINQKIFK